MCGNCVHHIHYQMRARFCSLTVWMESAPPDIDTFVSAEEPFSSIFKAIWTDSQKKKNLFIIKLICKLILKKVIACKCFFK